MSMTTLMDSLVTDLRTLLATSPACKVEKYWRLQPPKVMTCFVHPVREYGEIAVAIGNDFATGWEVNLYVETPWNDKEETAEAVQAVIDAVRGWVDANREFVAGYVLTCGEAPYAFVSRPGAGDPTYLITLPLKVEYPHLG